ncbi:MAG: winged helix-turn-helix transcriptional regulator [Chitinophagaceae bacterium]|nr:winged helix-turn-helix transcriptional regulator [Chitinophagaceae bacterium]
MSSFNLEEQENKMEHKIVVALERISEAFRVLLWNEGKENGLSPIQIQVLIFLLFHSREKCKVSYLAGEFNMTKATISDSVKLLLQKEYIRKNNDEADTRSYTISLTVKGKKIAEHASRFAGAIEKPVALFPVEQKKVLLQGLLKLIYELNKSGIITMQRMCFTCANYQNIQGVHYCKLLQSKLADTALRIDCAEHQPV